MKGFHILFHAFFPSYLKKEVLFYFKLIFDYNGYIDNAY